MTTGPEPGIIASYATPRRDLDAASIRGLGHELEDIITNLAEAGIEPEAGIKDEPFGRSFVVRDPDGSSVQVNEVAS